MKATEYLKNILQVNKPDSVKSLTLLISAIIAAFLGICLGAAMIIDVVKDGVLDMHMDDAGIFIVCLGGFIAGSGTPKIIGDRKAVISEKSDATDDSVNSQSV